jgi:CRP-like cAMP-binding protein
LSSRSEADLTTLRALPIFASLTDAQLEHVVTQIVKRAVVRGELVTLEGQPIDALYIVAAGSFKRYKTSISGREQVLKLLGPGESFGEVPLLDGGPDPASTMALEDGVLYMLPRSRFEALLRTSPDLALGLIQFLAGRLRYLTELVEDLSFRRTTERIAKLILEGSVDGRLTQSDIAAMAGTVRRVVSRALAELEERGAIELDRGHITVRDRTLLERVATGDHHR